MNQRPYPFTRFADQYTFISVGKRSITKMVEFSTGMHNGIFNLGFGDLQPDGTIDDMANSNNGDIIKVLSTVVEIIIDFTDTNSKSRIFFTGSTLSRISLYSRIIKMYYPEFKKHFVIKGIVENNGKFSEIDFDADILNGYVGFIVDKINYI
ncbi:MAG: hypothetical protein WCF67_15570 [Chitinophagaceae bacterium]